MGIPWDKAVIVSWGSLHPRERSIQIPCLIVLEYREFLPDDLINCLETDRTNISHANPTLQKSHAIYNSYLRFVFLFFADCLFRDKAGNRKSCYILLKVDANTCSNGSVPVNYVSRWVYIKNTWTSLSSNSSLQWNIEKNINTCLSV